MGDLIFLHHHSDLADSIATYGEDAINKINEEIIPTFKKNREAIRKLFNLLGENKNCKNWDLQKRYNFIATHQPPSEEEEIKSNITEAIENALRWDIGEHHLYSCIPLEDNRFNFEIGWLKDEDGEILSLIEKQAPAYLEPTQDMTKQILSGTHAHFSALLWCKNGRWHSKIFAYRIEWNSELFKNNLYRGCCRIVHSRNFNSCLAKLSGVCLGKNQNESLYFLRCRRGVTLYDKRSTVCRCFFLCIIGNKSRNACKTQMTRSVSDT